MRFAEFLFSMRLSDRIIFAYSDFHYLSLNCRSLIGPDNKNLAFVVQHGGFRAVNFILFTQTFEGKKDEEQSPIIIFLFGFTLHRNAFSTLITIGLAHIDILDGANLSTQPWKSK